MKSSLVRVAFNGKDERGNGLRIWLGKGEIAWAWSTLISCFFLLLLNMHEGKRPSSRELQVLVLFCDCH